MTDSALADLLSLRQLLAEAMDEFPITLAVAAIWTLRTVWPVRRGQSRSVAANRYSQRWATPFLLWAFGATLHHMRTMDGFYHGPSGGLTLYWKSAATDGAALALVMLLMLPGLVAARARNGDLPWSSGLLPGLSVSCSIAAVGVSYAIELWFWSLVSARAAEAAAL